MEKIVFYVCTSNIHLPLFTIFLLGLLFIGPVLSLIQKCYQCTDFVTGKNGSISGQCTRDLPGDSLPCTDVDDDIYRGLLLQDIFLPVGCMTSFKVYHDKTLDIVASVQRTCEPRSRNTIDGCSPKTTDSDASGDYTEVICRCSNEENCNHITWPTKDIGELPFTEPASNKDVMDTYLAGKGRYCLIGSGIVDVRTGEQRGEGFFPDIKKQKRLCEHVAVIKSTMVNYPAKSRFVYCKTVYEMHGSELNITRGCETQMVPVKDHCVRRGNVKMCYCNSDVCNNKVWDEESGMTHVPVVPVDMVESDVREDGSDAGYVVPKKNVDRKPKLGSIFAPKLEFGNSGNDRNGDKGMLNACHRCDGQINRNTGTITGSCFLVDSIFTSSFSTQTLENCTNNDSEIADAVSTYPTTPLECVTTFTHYSDPRKTIEAKVERRCALKSPFSKDGCTRPDKRSVKNHEELTVTCRCFSYDGCNTDKWTLYNMANTIPFVLTPRTWAATVKNGMDSRARVCHVCWASRSSASPTPACFSGASLSSNTKEACFDNAHITGTIMNLPAETHFVHCFTKFAQTKSTQTMERGCEVRLAPVQDRCDSKGYCTCNSNGCNVEEWNDGGWQPAKGSETLIGEASSQASTVDIETSGSYAENTETAESDNVTDAPPVVPTSAIPADNAGGISGLVRSCYWCKGTVERTTGVLTGCFGGASATKEKKVECGEKDPNIRTVISANRSTELECITTFRYNTDTYSTHEATLQRKCGIRQPTSVPTERCSRTATGTYTEVVCRCSNDNYCNDDTWPTTEMGRVPFTTPTAALPPTGSMLWGKGRSCHECEGKLNVRTGKVHGCFFQDGLTSATVVRCAHASQNVKAILRNVPANHHFIHCVTEFAERNSTGKLMVRRYCDVRVAPVTDGCTNSNVNGKVIKTCRCNKNHCNNGTWENQTGLVALPVNVVVPVGILDVMDPPKPVTVNDSQLEPSQPENLACYQCVNPPDEKDSINGECFSLEKSSVVNCSDDPRLVDIFRDFPGFVPMCETEMKTTAKRPHKYSIKRSCTARTLEEVGYHQTTLRAPDKDGYKVNRWRCLESYCNSQFPQSDLIEQDTTIAPPESSTSGPNVTSVTVPPGDPTTAPDLTWPSSSVFENTTRRRSTHHRTTTDQPVTFYPPLPDDNSAYPSIDTTKHRRSTHKPSTDTTVDSYVWNNSTYEPMTDDTTAYPSTDTTKQRRSSHKASLNTTVDSDTAVWDNSTYGPVTDDLQSSTKKQHRSTTEPWVSSTDQPYVESTTYPPIDPVDSTVRHYRSRTTQATSMAPPAAITTRGIVLFILPKPTEKPQQCACANPYCCPPPQSYPCGNPYGCQQWKCTNPAYCPPPGPNPWSCTNIMNCRPPGPNPWNCSSPWDCDVPDKNVWNCSCPWNCGPYEPWNCKSPFDCKPPSDYQKCLNDPPKCRDVPEWLVKWWGTHQQQTFPSLPPVSIRQTQNVVHKRTHRVS